MKRKTLLITILALVLCFSFTLISPAASISPKSLVLKGIDGMDLGYYQKFYRQSSGSVHYEIEKFEGSGISIPSGTSLNCSYKMDAPDNKLAFDFNLNYNDETYRGQFYLDRDKWIFTKSCLKAISDLVPESNIGDLNEYPDYIYMSDPSLAQIWSTMLKYPSPKVNESTKELIKFIVEAIPDEYFSFNVSETAVVLELDQEEFEEVIFCILDKIKNEKERFAIIIQDIALAYSGTAPLYTGYKLEDLQDKALADSDADPVDNRPNIKEDIINGINDMVESDAWPSKQNVKTFIGSLFEIKQFKYLYSITGKENNFVASMIAQPETGFNGRLDIKTNSKGSFENLKGNYQINLSFTEPGGTSFNGILKGDVTNIKDTITQNIVISGTAQKAGKKQFDVEVTGSTIQQLEPDMVINVPVLTNTNSKNIESYVKNGGSATRVVVPHGQVAIFVDNRVIATDAIPFVKNGRLMVPIRFVAESLNSEVWWEDPNIIRVKKGNKDITMYVGETRYILNSQALEMDTVPVIKEGRTFVPVRFVAEALDCNVEYTENKVYIETR